MPIVYQSAHARTSACTRTQSVYPVSSGLMATVQFLEDFFDFLHLVGGRFQRNLLIRTHYARQEKINFGRLVEAT
jgi:hypothetical protein